jgi:SAM-dependent methyltransferase
MEDGPEDNGWSHSADAWIASLGEDGDWSRRHVLDHAMLESVGLYAPLHVSCEFAQCGSPAARPFVRALDVGCGEGRFCRMLAKRGINATGLEPTPELVREARRRDPSGTYVEGFAEKLPFADHTFDLVVSYMRSVALGGAPRQA